MKTPKERSRHFEEITKNEVKFLKSQGHGHMNEHGAWAYMSNDGNHLIALDLYLMHYKEWLIENEIVKPIKR
jgi:hypothetical protein